MLPTVLLHDYTVTVITQYCSCGGCEPVPCKLPTTAQATDQGPQLLDPKSKPTFAQGPHFHQLLPASDSVLQEL